MKPVLDMIIAFTALLILSPILVIAALLIKMDSKGPVFFLQERLGKGKKKFVVFKFRTMTHKKRLVEKQVYKDNPEVTLIGKYLRRYKIDELPQILNVLFGDMSIVGPRPCLPDTPERFNLTDDRRFLVKPGLTSVAGVNGSIYLDWKDKWEYDGCYTENISFWIDLRIILKTVLVVIFGEEKFLKRPEKLKNENS